MDESKFCFTELRKYHLYHANIFYSHIFLSFIYPSNIFQCFSSIHGISFIYPSSILQMSFIQHSFILSFSPLSFFLDLVSFCYRSHSHQRKDRRSYSASWESWYNYKWMDGILLVLRVNVRYCFVCKGQMAGRFSLFHTYVPCMTTKLQFSRF